MQVQVQVFGIPQSNYVRAIRMVCEEKQVPYELIPLMPGTEEAKALHPFGKIPAMQHGEVRLCESKAIATYLESLFPDPPLFPKDPRELALLEQWVSLVNTVIDRTLIRQYGLGYYLAQLQGRAVDRAAIDAVLPAMREQILLLDRSVAASGFLVGRHFTYADVSLLPMLSVVRSCPEGAEAFSQAHALTAYFDTHSQRPSFRATAVAP